MRPPYALQHRPCSTRPKTSRLEKKKPFKRRYSCDTARSYNMQRCSVGHGTRGDTDRPIHTHASIFAAQVSRLVSAHAEASGRADVAEAAAQVCLPQLHQYWAHPCHIYPGPTHLCHIGTGTLSI
jgi:hypothetical protein